MHHIDGMGTSGRQVLAHDAITLFRHKVEMFGTPEGVMASPQPLDSQVLGQITFFDLEGFDFTNGVMDGSMGCSAKLQLSAWFQLNGRHSMLKAD